MSDQTMAPPLENTRQRIIDQLIDLVGADYVQTDRDDLFSYALALNGSMVWPLLVIFPTKRSQLVALVQLAREQQLTLHPVSRGRNYGYGTAQGTQQQQVVVDLKHLNKIVELNEDQAYVTLEPGVSQAELYAYLEKKQSRLQMDVTGAGGDASVVGNVLERGFGHTDYGNRFDSLLGMEVLLPDGTLIQTGFGDYHQAQAKAYRHGMGPSVDGLFTQSNFGIVTQVTLALQPKPAYFCMFIYLAKHEEDLEKLVHAVRELKLDGVLDSCVHIANKGRLAKPGQPNKAGEWNISASLSGPKALAMARKKAIQQAFKKYGLRGKAHWITDAKLKLADFVDRRIFSIEAYAMLQEATKLKKGIPTDSYVKDLMNDSNATSSNLVSSERNQYFKWISAVSSADPAAVRQLVKLTQEALAERGYAFRVTLTFINERSLIMISEISYPNEKEAIAKAAADYTEIIKHLALHGYYAYRSGPGSFESVVPDNVPLINFLRSLKATIDPDQILAPGKYKI